MVSDGNDHICTPKLITRISNSLNYLLITLVFHLAPPEFYALGANWAIVIPPITANRLLINMEYSRFTNTTGSTVNANTFTSVEFAGGVEATTFPK
jgi:hypothetical protein